MLAFLKWFRCWLFCKWRVKYPCGGWSIPMPYQVASTYRTIFGGELHPEHDFKAPEF